MTMINDKLGASQQENLLALLAYSDEHGRLLATVDPALFEGDYREIATRAIDYWRQQGEAPKHHTADLFADILEDQQNRKAPTFRRILVMMLQLSESINSAYVMTDLNRFITQQKMKATILRSADLLHNNPYSPSSRSRRYGPRY